MQGMGPASGSSIHEKYFGEYLPGRLVPTLVEFKAIAPFALFDEAVKAVNRRLRGQEKERFLRDTSECLEHILKDVFNARPSVSEFGYGLDIEGVGMIHIGAWVAKCFSDPIADSISCKCAVFLRPPELDTNGNRSVAVFDELLESSSYLALCDELRCVENSMDRQGHLLTDLIQFATKSRDVKGLPDIRHFQGPCDELQQHEALACATVVQKLDDLGWHGDLWSPYASSFLPGAHDMLLGRVGKGWPFAHLRACITYLQDAPNGPNGKLFERIWKLWKLAGRPTDEDELVGTLHLLLKLIEKKSFHHTIKDFKRILKLFPEARMDKLSEFQPREPQRCYAALTELLRGYPAMPWSTKRDVIQLLDTASGKFPKSAWEKKRAKLQATEHWPSVVLFADWLLEDEGLGRAQVPHGWSDSIYSRFVKASEWIVLR